MLRAFPLACPDLRAFPGAEGFGAFTPGGRGGQVIHVTNLNGSGPGSLREAVETSGPRIVIFDVGGTIVLTSNIVITEPFLTLAGQTAPGGGIMIRNAGIRIETHNVIIRGMRVRVGDEGGGEYDGIQIVNHTVGAAHDIIVDHCSVSWGIDENLDIFNGAANITFQWNITSEGLYDSIHSKGPHSAGLIVGQESRQISIHHNLFAHNYARNPLMSIDTTSEIINNVVYNWNNMPTSLTNCSSTTPSLCDLIGNYYKTGVDLNTTWGIHTATCWQNSSIYVQGNIGPGRPTDTGDEWALVKNVAGDGAKSLVPVMASGVTTQGVNEAYDLVLAQAGAISPSHDSVDERVIQSVQDGTGSVIDSQNDVGGWPVLAGGTPPVDSNQDGIPDSWVPTALCGYDPIEVYVNSLIPMPVMV